ncbi:MAG: hypothetical protein JSU86_00980 [Phycisphaerales bacterium]|nr:MAG: hypothetical protein JSU86_00980 [Phycisphaerales bacterium]
MDDIDAKIRDALPETDAEVFDELSDEQSLCQMVIDSFRTRHRWMVAIMFFWIAAYFIVAIFSAVRFFQAETTRVQIAWAVAFMFCVTAISMMKAWYWMELNKNAVTRRIKRLELQIARLAQRIKD